MSRQQPLLLTSATGVSTHAVAGEVIQRSTPVRAILASSFIIGGLLLAVPCIIVPVVHLISTWAFPLLGIVLGVRIWNRTLLIFDIDGPCPSCNAPIQLGGGSPADPSWQRCPECNAALSVHLANHCIHCNYDLRGADHAVCPECGEATSRKCVHNATQPKHPNSLNPNP